ncbi:MAG: hypothetical protein KGL35_25765 [Bradyrhizobium sp.]|nr:hypothetical protein [Bradyrhizobium sp.]
MAKDSFGTNVNRPGGNGSMKPPPPGYQMNDTGKPGGAPTGSTPMLGGRQTGYAPKPVGGKKGTMAKGQASAKLNKF